MWGLEGGGKPGRLGRPPGLPGSQVLTPRVPWGCAPTICVGPRDRLHSQDILTRLPHLFHCPCLTEMKNQAQLLSLTSLSLTVILMPCSGLPLGHTEQPSR